MTAYQRKTKYYRGVVYEYNLPVGHSCPFAKLCLVKVDKKTGKFENKSSNYKCYAAAAERFPGVRNSRWTNFENAKNSIVPHPPKLAKSIRVHGSGDFFSQSYFDCWIDIALQNPEKEFWAYTKSLKYWVRRITEIPDNLVLTASVGGTDDYLISDHNLKHVVVVASDKDTLLPIDTNDDLARDPSIKCFALIDNYAKK
ncbi:MAG: hypothetical protein GY920_03155 [Aliivibrio sp.]|nr:hypothetical protein [Aliivibrio sp.]